MNVCMYAKAPLSGGVIVKKAPETTLFCCSHECGQRGPWKYEHTHTVTKTTLQNRFHCRSRSNEVNQTRLCKSAIQVGKDHQGNEESFSATSDITTNLKCADYLKSLESFITCCL